MSSIRNFQNFVLACSFLLLTDSAQAQHANQGEFSSAPVLRGVTNGTIGPKGSDATVIQGIIAPPTRTTLNDRLRDNMENFMRSLVPVKNGRIRNNVVPNSTSKDMSLLLKGPMHGSTAVTEKSEPKVAPQAWTEQRVPAGLVEWNADFAKACRSSKISGKPVLVFQMMGQLDHEFC